MNDPSAVAVIVLSRHQDDSEAVSRHLRNAGIAAHCRWVSQNDSLGEQASQCEPQLMLVFDPTRLGAAVAFRDRHVADMSVVMVGEEFNHEVLIGAMAQGAQDYVPLMPQTHFVAVAKRELRTCRCQRELAGAAATAQEYQRRVESMVSASTKALMYVSEGILGDVNPACLELLGYVDAEDVTGIPIMDLFEPDSQTTLKGAIVACTKGMWTGHAIRCRALCSDGSPLAVEAHLDEDSLEGEACVRIELTAATAREEVIGERLAQSTDNDPLSGFYFRRNFLREISVRLEQPSKGGVQALCHVRPDRFSALLDHWGPIGCDELLLEIARIVQDTALPDDMFGQLAGGSFAVLTARGNHRDIEAWADHLRTRIAQNKFHLEGERVKVTLSIGAAVYDTRVDDLSSLSSKAAKASRIAQERGGNRVLIQRDPDEQPVETIDDRRVVSAIKQALMTDGFKLVYQPIANLQEQRCYMFDVLLRMMDANNREILPNHFLPAAERNQMMKSVDRWVLSHALKAAAEQSSTQLFVRLSNQSLPDKTLAAWLAEQFDKTGVDPKQLVIQITELNASEHLGVTAKLIRQLRQFGCGFAIEHFGVGESPIEILEELAVDYVKVDGSLMQGLSSTPELQDSVKNYVNAARDRNVITIAERVEDANTMAALWQIGVEFIQGYYVQGHYVQGPEKVVLETA